MTLNRRVGTLLLLAALTVQAGCGTQQQESVSATVFSMDTVMTVTAYGDRAAEAVAAATEEIYRLERLLSVTREDSDIGRINAAGGEPVEVSEETAALLALALEIFAETEGAFSPALYPLLTAWGFTTGDYRVPEAAELEALLAAADAREVRLAGRTVTLAEGMALDLGGIAKGYTGDRLAAIAAAEGITSAVFDLGGDVRTVGRNGEGKPWRVALQDPAGEGYMGVLEVEDAAVITSGSYERYFTGGGGEHYHHILDPATGYPADSGLLSVTVVTESGAAGDALATALFAMGLERATAFLQGVEGVEAVLLTDTGALYLTGGLRDSFTPEGEYANLTPVYI